MSEQYEAGYIHGSAFACMTVAIDTLSKAVAYVDDSADLREALRNGRGRAREVGAGCLNRAVLSP